MGRGFESHRGHQKESQMTCNEPFGFFFVHQNWQPRFLYSFNKYTISIYQTDGESGKEATRLASKMCQSRILFSNLMTLFLLLVNSVFLVIEILAVATNGHLTTQSVKEMDIFLWKMWILYIFLQNNINIVAEMSIFTPRQVTLPSFQCHSKEL